MHYQIVRIVHILNSIINLNSFASCLLFENKLFEMIWHKYIMVLCRDHTLFIWLTSIYITHKNVRLASVFSSFFFFQAHRTLSYITEDIEGPDQAGIYAQIELVIGFSCMYMLKVMYFLL